MSTVFVKPEDLMKIRELRLRQEIAQTQAQSHGYAMQAELGRLYLRLGLAADDSINIDTGVITIAHPKPESDTDIPVGAVPVDGVKQTTDAFDELRRHAEKLDSSDHGRSGLAEAMV